MLTKGAIGNLVNRYRAVLKKCHLLNTFGSLAVASMLVLGGAGAAWGGHTPISSADLPYSFDVEYKWSGTDAVDNNGGVFYINSNVEVSCSSDFIGNKAIYAGGAIYNSGKLILDGGKFTNNNVYLDVKNTIKPYGGAIYNDGELEINNDVEFIGSKALNEQYLYNKTFGWTKADGMGGAIYSKNKLTINGSAITMDAANKYNGGVLFRGNESGSGGAIEIYGSSSTLANVRLTNVRFENNITRGGGGGAVRLSNGAQGAYFENVYFIENQTGNDGGAVYIHKDNTDGVTFKNAYFYDNEAGTNGGALYIHQGKVTFNGVNEFRGNTVKSAPNDIFNSGTMVIESGSTTLYSGIKSTGKIQVTEDASFTVDTRAAGSDPFQGCAINITGEGDITLRSSKSIIKDSRTHSIEGNNITLETKGGTVIESRGDIKLDAAGRLDIIGDVNITKTKTSDTAHLEIYANSGALDAVSIGDGAKFDLFGKGEGSNVELEKLTNSGESKLGDGMTRLAASVGEIDMQGGTLNIIDSDVTIGKLKTAGGTIFIDPSNVKVGDLEGTLDADFFIGKESTVAFGDADMSSAPEVGTEVTAALALGPGKSIEVGTGSLVVDGTLSGAPTPPPADGTVKFAADSLLVVDGATEGGVIRGSGGALTVEDGAKLHINNARVGEFTVASNFDPNAITVGGWNGSNLTLTTSNVLTEAVAATPDGDDVIVSIVAKDAASVFPDLRVPCNVDTMMAEGQNDTSDDAPAGIRMLSRALEKTASPDSIDAVNEAAGAAVTVGVQNTALRIADAASNTVIGHLSLAQHDGSRAIHADGADFWAAPMYGNLYTSGMAASGQSVRGQFGGLALGADVEAGQFLGGKLRIGASINGGGGQSETSGTATRAQNDYDFGGLNFYAGWNNGALNLMASVGYAFGNHEVEMGLPASLGMSSAKADVDTSAFAADLRAEYQLKTGWLDVLPHVGVRYTALRTDAHDLKSGGEVLNSVERDTQNIVQFPIGVTLSRDFDLAGWALKPAVDLSFIPAAGDKDARTSVNFSGIDAVDSFDTRIMDSTSWAATVGVQAEKGAFSLGLNYGVQASSHETDQNVQLKLGWKF